MIPPILSTTSAKLRRLRRILPDVNFLTIHYTYFIFTGLLCGLILWGSATPQHSVSFIDALFLAVSAMTESGLNTVNLSTLNTWQQFVLFVLMMLGSAIFVSAFVVVVRLKAFEREFARVVHAEHTGMTSIRESPTLVPQDEGNAQMRSTLPRLDDQFQLTDRRINIGSDPATAEREAGKSETASMRRPPPSLTTSEIELSRAERERLGGTEYEAVRLLSILVPTYFFLWQFLTCISCGWWVAAHRASTTRANGLNPWWTGAFNAVSAFNNNGMSLLDANMTAFQDAYFLLITMGLLILAGNTGYPIFLRMIVWSMWKWLPERMSETKRTLRFLLDHPRRCYTHLFDSNRTWWLAMALIILNGVDWAAFEVLNIGNNKITQLDDRVEVIDGLFQALAVRSGGFYIVPIPNIRISLQVLYVLMMYVSVYPVAISMRNSNVYEEKSLGIFAQPEADDDIEDGPVKDDPPPVNGRLSFLRRAQTIRQTRKSRSFFVRHQVRAQLADDAYWIALAVFVIMIIEGSQFERDPINFSVFNVIFEVVVSASCDICHCLS